MLKKPDKWRLQRQSQGYPHNPWNSRMLNTGSRTNGTNNHGKNKQGKSGSGTTSVGY